METGTRTRDRFVAMYEVMERSLSAFESWNEELGDVDFLESKCVTQLRGIATDISRGDLSVAFDESQTPFTKTKEAQR